MNKNKQKDPKGLDNRFQISGNENLEVQLNNKKERKSKMQGFQQKSFRDQRIVISKESEESEAFKRQQQKPLYNSVKKINYSYQKEKDKEKDRSSSTLLELQQQKMFIQQQIKELDTEILKLSKKRHQSVFKQRQKIYQDEKARQNAIKLIKNLKAQKKQCQQKKLKKLQKLKEELKANEQLFIKLKQQKLQQNRQKKRSIIQQKHQQKAKRQQILKQFQKQSNKLILSILKQEEALRQKQIHDNHLILEKLNQYNKPQYTKESFINVRDIEKHEQSYLKIRQEYFRNKRNGPLEYPLKKYSKNRWATLLENKEVKQKQEEKLKEIERQNRIQKMKKYGEKTYKVMVIKRRVKTVMQNEKKDQNLQTQKPAQNKNKSGLYQIGFSSSIKNLRNSENQSFQRTFDKKKSIKIQKFVEKAKEPRSPQQQKKKQAQIRQQTMKRLKFYSSIDAEDREPQQSKPKYENYLGSLHVKKPKEHTILKTILNNSNLSSKDQNYKILNHAITLQSKAKIQEEYQNIKKEEVTNLYIHSIQAKLILISKLQII